MAYSLFKDFEFKNLNFMKYKLERKCQAFKCHCFLLLICLQKGGDENAFHTGKPNSNANADMEAF